MLPLEQLEAAPGVGMVGIGGRAERRLEGQFVGMAQQ